MSLAGGRRVEGGGVWRVSWVEEVQIGGGGAAVGAPGNVGVDVAFSCRGSGCCGGDVVMMWGRPGNVGVDVVLMWGSGRRWG
uniref:Uncharacterized protein n=1 Tax=Knipowitschia caucasica TaxID=637954 RepID=A0AAV2KZ62_KNICA